MLTNQILIFIARVLVRIFRAPTRDTYGERQADCDMLDKELDSLEERVR